MTESTRADDLFFLSLVHETGEKKNTQRSLAPSKTAVSVTCLVLQIGRCCGVNVLYAVRMMMMMMIGLSPLVCNCIQANRETASYHCAISTAAANAHAPEHATDEASSPGIKMRILPPLLQRANAGISQTTKVSRGGGTGTCG